MTLVGVRNHVWRLLCWRRARLLCCLVLCDLTLGLLFRWCLVCELCRLTVVRVDCRCFLSLVFLGGVRRLELSLCNTGPDHSECPLSNTRHKASTMTSSMHGHSKQTANASYVCMFIYIYIYVCIHTYICLSVSPSTYL